MKRSILALFTAITAFTLNSCLPPVEGCTDPTANNFYEFAEKDDGSCKYTGRIAFWTDSDNGCGDIEVFVNGAKTGTVSKPFTSDVATCKHDDILTVELTPGTYEVYAIDGCGDEWSGTVKLESITCTAFVLHR